MLAFVCEGRRLKVVRAVSGYFQKVLFKSCTQKLESPSISTNPLAMVARLLCTCSDPWCRSRSNRWFKRRTVLKHKRRNPPEPQTTDNENDHNVITDMECESVGPEDSYHYYTMWLCHSMLALKHRYKVSVVALSSVLAVVFCFLYIVRHPASTHFPRAWAALREFVGLDTQGHRWYAICTNIECNQLYPLSEVICSRKVHRNCNPCNTEIYKAQGRQFVAKKRVLCLELGWFIKKLFTNNEFTAALALQASSVREDGKIESTWDAMLWQRMSKKCPTQKRYRKPLDGFLHQSKFNLALSLRFVERASRQLTLFTALIGFTLMDLPGKHG